MEARQVGALRCTEVRQPGAMWIHPEFSPFSLRQSSHSEWATTIIDVLDGKFMDSLLERHYQLKPGDNICDPVLEYLLKTLIEQLLDTNAHAQIT
tara:strand:+ start:1511 stop:1795 length:285 start_codon:yes stop_codon:yes gene_type:complete